jgi:hypothetical protein
MRDRREPSGLRSRHPVDDKEVAFSLVVVERTSRRAKMLASSRKVAMALPAGA